MWKKVQCWSYVLPQYRIQIYCFNKRGLDPSIASTIPRFAYSFFNQLISLSLEGKDGNYKNMHLDFTQDHFQIWEGMLYFGYVKKLLICPHKCHNCVCLSTCKTLAY